MLTNRPSRTITMARYRSNTIRKKKAYTSYSSSTTEKTFRVSFLLSFFYYRRKLFVPNVLSESIERDRICWISDRRARNPENFYIIEISNFKGKNSFWEEEFGGNSPNRGWEGHHLLFIGYFISYFGVFYRFKKPVVANHIKILVSLLPFPTRIVFLNRSIGL